MSAPSKVALGDVASFVRGLTFKPDDVVPQGTQGSIACMRTKNVQTNLAVDDVWGVPATLVKRDEQVLRFGDVLVSSANSWNLVGKCCWIPHLPWKSSFGGFVTVLRSSSNRLHDRFLYQWFSSGPIQKLLRSFGQKTTNISNLNIDRCLSLAIPLPTVAEQRRIAAILDQAEALRAQRRAAIALLDQLAHSIFFDCFGDPAVNPHSFPEGNVGDLLSSATYGTSQKASSEGAFPVLRMGNINSNGEMDLTQLKYMDLSPVDFDRYVVRPGDVLFNRTNSAELVGKTAMVKDKRPMAYAGYLVRLRVRPEHTSEFLVSFLNSPHAKVVLRSMAKSIVGMANINAKEVQAMRCFIPPKALQERFAERIRSLDHLKSTHLTALAHLDALFASLQHRAFRGEL